MLYAQSDNNQPFKGDGGPLIGLLLWPQTDDAKDYLTPAGNRRRITTLDANSRSRQSVLQRQQEQDQREHRPAQRRISASC